MDKINDVDTLIQFENENISKIKIISVIFFDFLYKSINIKLSNDEKIIYNNILSNRDKINDKNKVRTKLYKIFKKLKHLDINSKYNFYPISICDDNNTIKFFDLNFIEYYLFEVNSNQDDGQQ